MEKILYKYIRGSKAHGIATPQSDTDMGGVFLAPQYTLLGLGLNYKDEISDERHDVVYWELAKFGRLLLKSNPSVLEALFVDPEFRLETNCAMKPLFEMKHAFLTKQCFAPFGTYAANQIRRARGLNKMINQPILERKTPVDFCYVTSGNDTKSVHEWLKEYNLSEDQISLAKLNHARDAYAVYIFPGGFCKPNGNDVHCTDIPKGLPAVATLFFNKDAYTIHCKDYKSQKEWEQKRNPVRYESNLGHSYDAKNMCECLRLVHTCTEIANGDTYHVNRQGLDAHLLLDIRAHNFEYDELMEMCEDAVEKMNKAIEMSTIPDSIDSNMVDEIIYDIRKRLY